MRISTESVLSAAVESIEWSYDQNELNSFESALESASDAIHEAIDSALVYTRDIEEYWNSVGAPEPEEMSDTISHSIISAVYESLRESVTEHDVIEQFVSDHQDTLDNSEDFDGCTDDTEDAFNALVEYRESL